MYVQDKKKSGGLGGILGGSGGGGGGGILGSNTGKMAAGLCFGTVV